MFVPRDGLERLTKTGRNTIRCVITPNNDLEAGDLMFSWDFHCEFDYGILLGPKGGRK